MRMELKFRWIGGTFEWPIFMRYLGNFSLQLSLEFAVFFKPAGYLLLAFSSTIVSIKTYPSLFSDHAFSIFSQLETSLFCYTFKNLLFGCLNDQYIISRFVVRFCLHVNESARSTGLL